MKERVFLSNNKDSIIENYWMMHFLNVTDVLTNRVNCSGSTCNLTLFWRVVRDLRALLYSISFTFPFPAIHAAALAGHASTIKLLLDFGAQMNARDSLRHTPLFRACEMGHADVVQALIDCGAQVDIVDQDGRTPLHWYCSVWIIPHLHGAKNIWIVIWIPIWIAIQKMYLFTWDIHCPIQQSASHFCSLFSHCYIAIYLDWNYPDWVLTWEKKYLDPDRDLDNFALCKPGIILSWHSWLRFTHSADGIEK